MLWLTLLTAAQQCIWTSFNIVIERMNVFGQCCLLTEPFDYNFIGNKPFFFLIWHRGKTISTRYKIMQKNKWPIQDFFHSQSLRWHHPLTNLSRRTQSLPFVCPPRLKLSVLSRALAFQRAIIQYGKTNRKMTILDTSGLKARWDTWRLRMLEESRFYTWSSICRYLPMCRNVNVFFPNKQFEAI